MSEATAFFPGIAERLDAYVYLLVDPRNAEIFYVGKGRGDRAHQHARGSGSGTPKLDRIRAVQAAGHQVAIEVLRHGMTDDVAHAVEAAAIDLLRFTGSGLTNAVSGHDTRERGWMALTELRARYGAEPLVPRASDRIMIVRINKAYRTGLGEDELYEITRQWWRVDPARRRPTVALAVYNGVVRRAYRVDPNGWEQREDDRRWRFSGSTDPILEQHYEWRDVSGFVAAGAQNPITYVTPSAAAGSAPAIEIEAEAPQSVDAPARLDPDDRIVMFRISKAFRPDMSEHELYEATRQWWRMDPVGRRPDIALAVADGTIQRAYRIESWEQRSADQRWRFIGSPADDIGARYEGVSTVNFWKPGAQNPVAYMHCD